MPPLSFETLSKISATTLIVLLVMNTYFYARIFQTWKPVADLRHEYKLSLLTRLAGYLRPIVLLCFLGQTVLRGFVISIPIDLTNVVVGISLSLLGNILLRKSLYDLGRNFSPCQTGLLPIRIVRTWPFRYLRHPIYISNLMFLSGFLIIFPGALTWFGFVSIFVLYVSAAFDEERGLKRHQELSKDYVSNWNTSKENPGSSNQNLKTRPP